MSGGDPQLGPEFRDSLRVFLRWLAEVGTVPPGNDPDRTLDLYYGVEGDGETADVEATDSADGGNYPEHMKLKAVSGRSNVIGGFLDWLMHNKLEINSYSYGLVYLAYYHGRSERLHPLPIRISDLLAHYFEIDQQKIEAEKTAMLDAMRAMHESAGAS